MAIFLFIFAALCGVLAALISVMLFPIGIPGGILVFFVTCYSVVALPLLVDLALSPRKG